ncbi:MAG: hypothetical protein ED555_07860 [Allomuricauda sp.]|nr:MAG: hypothetical protein ED555_07860 [Allomuricauda sp.]
MKEQANAMHRSKQDVDAPSNIISADEAKNLHKNYMANRATLIEEHERNVNDNEGYQATQYVEWNIKDIEQYLAYLKEQAALANTTVETIRIYQGQYCLGNNHNVDTMVWVPTTKIEGKTRGFYIDQEQHVQPVGNQPEVDEETVCSLFFNRGQSGPPPMSDWD